MKRQLERIAGGFYDLANRYRRFVTRIVYTCLVVLAYTLSFLLEFQFTLPGQYTTAFLVTLAVLLGVRHVVSVFFGLSTGRWRFVSTRDVLRLGVTTTVGTAIFIPIAHLLPVAPSIPNSVFVLEWVFTNFFTASLWILYRTAYEQLRHFRSGINGTAQRVIIVGAGEAGNLLVREMVRFPTGYRPVAFVDDDRTKWGIRLHGIDVTGPTAKLPEIASAVGAQMVIIAIPSAQPSQLRSMVEQCERTGLPFKVLPGIAQVLRGDIEINQIRDVRIEDLLGREPIELKLPELAADLAGRSVLITGAAGSIGSELARQVALHQPRILVLFDQAETDLFFLEMELRERHPELDIVPVVGDIVDRAAVESTFIEYAPDRVFHAAAYKHVPMMEINPREAVRNNVVGTWRVAEAAGRHGARKFVLVSTDKAVRPVNVMGATKRAAELTVLEMQVKYPMTFFSAVRFGNVLGSSGSVIPIFHKQLQQGRPLTVTHPDATRYFMTIPEAVQLILQASVLPEMRGSVAMLEMGEPVRIRELAENLLRLAGLPTEENRIVYTGLRPGERLHEELMGHDEQTVPTSNAKVRVLRAAMNSHWPMLEQLPRWEEALDARRTSELVATLAALFPTLPNVSVPSRAPAQSAAG